MQAAFKTGNTRWQRRSIHPCGNCFGVLTLRWSEVMFTSSWLLGWSLSNRTVSAPLQYRRILPSGLRTEDQLQHVEKRNVNYGMSPFN